jgi:hypothetical protein
MCARAIIILLYTLHKPRKFAELRRQHLQYATFKWYMRKSICISAKFQVSKALCRGPEFSCDYDLGFIMHNYIIIT